MPTSFAEFLLVRRGFLTACLLLVAAAAAWGAHLLTFSNDYRIFFSRDNPQLAAFDALQNTYTKSDNVLFVVAPRDGNVFTRRTLAAVEWLTAQAWRMPYSIRVDSVTNFQYTRADGDDLVVTDLVENAERYSTADLARVRSIAVNEPLLVKRLISPTGHVTAVNVTVQLPGRDTSAEMPAVLAFSRALVLELRQRDPELNVYLTGIVPMNSAFDENAIRDMRTLVPIMFAVIAALLALTLRSLGATLATLFIIGLSIASAVGAAGWLGIRMTPPVAIAPTMIMTLAVADCVHFFATYLQTARGGRDRLGAVRESLRVNLQPIFLTSLTTVIGFLSMNFSDSPPFRDLGNVVAMGVGFAWIYAVVLLPALATLVTARPSSARRPSKATPIMDRFANFVLRRTRLLLWGMGLLTLVLVASVPMNELNDQFVEYFDRSVPFRRDTDFTVQNLTGVYSVSYSLHAASPGGITEPEYLRALDAFADWFRSQPEVLQVSNFSEIMKRLNRNLHADDPAWYRIPDRRDLAAQYLLLYEMSLPFGLDLNNQIDVGKSATRFDVYLKNLSSRQVLALDRRAQDWLEAHAPAYMRAEGASPALMFSRIGMRNIRSMLIGTVTALFLISLVLIGALRSFRLGMISLVPNLVPAGMAFGLWGWTEGQVGLGLSVVAGMTLGIVVDDTVHFLSKYLRARREGNRETADAVRYAFHTVGNAMWITSVVLVAGFLVLTFSPFQLNAQMGLMTAVTIAFALLADFLLLPALLLTLDRTPQNRPVPTWRERPDVSFGLPSKTKESNNSSRA